MTWESTLSKKFYVKSKTGGVRLLVRENYLREDIPCQHAFCETCTHSIPKRLNSSRHLVIPTGPVLQFFLELIEECSAAASLTSLCDQTDFAFAQTVFLQTCVAQTIQSSAVRTLVGATPGVGSWGIQAERRIQALVDDLRRQVVLFRNENSLHTALPRPPDLDQLAHHRSLVWRAAHHLAAHLDGKISAVIVVDAPDLAATPDLAPRLPSPILPPSRPPPPASPPNRFTVTIPPPRVMIGPPSALDPLPPAAPSGLQRPPDAGTSAAPRTPVWSMTLADYLAWATATPDHLRRLFQSLQETVTAALRRPSHPAGPSLDGTGPLVPVTFCEYLDSSLLEAGIDAGTMYKGKLQVAHSTPYEAMVADASQGLDIFIPSKVLMNRAIEGDTVVVQLLPESQWSAPSSILRHQRADGGVLKSHAVSAFQLSQPKMPTGRVVGVLEMHRRSYVATLDAESLQGAASKGVLAVPMDLRIPKIRLSTRRAQELLDQRLVVRIDRWVVDARYPEGHLFKELGKIGEEQTEVDAILVERDVAVEDFTPSMTSPLPDGKTWQPSTEELATRRDLRHSHLVMSIDPPGCTDIDDALSVQELEGGRLLEIGVHIADVSAFVLPDSLLDMEARFRGTTVYLAHRRFDMLPEVLSANLCSLREQQERYAMSVMWKLDAKSYEVLDVWFGRTIIRSSFALAYQQAQKILDCQDNPAQLPAEHRPLIRPLQLLIRFTDHLQRIRIANGALGLGSTEIHFDLESIDKENTGGEFALDVKSLSLKEELPVNAMVAECMILANQAVAERIFKFFPTAALLRRHPPPVRKNTKDIEDIMRQQGFHLESLTNKAFARFLDASNQLADPNVRALIRSVATRALNEAKYISSGEFSVEDYAHYGLALSFYTHFTSPIRRYADLVVHRLLWQTILLERHPHQRLMPGLPDLALRSVCLHINQKNRNAKMAAQDSKQFLLMLYLQKHPEQVYEAVISSVRSNGFIAQITYLGINGTAYLLGIEGEPVNLPLPFTQVALNPTLQEIELTAPDGARKVLHRLDRVAIRITVNPSRYRIPQPVCILHGFDLDPAGLIGLSGRLQHRLLVPSAAATSSSSPSHAPFHFDQVSDVFLSPTKQEGLNVQLLLSKRRVSEFSKPIKNGRISFS